MVAIRKNLGVVEAGATCHIGFVYCAPAVDENGDVVLDANGNPTPGEPIALTGCTARMQVRAKVGDEVALITATTATDDSVGAGRIVLEASDPDTGLPATGRVDITLTDLDTMELQPFKTAVYDLEIVWPLEDGELRQHVDRLLQGSIIVDKNVTRTEVADV